MPKKLKVKKVFMGALIKKLFGRFNEEKLPEQYYNMNFKSIPGKNLGVPKVEGLDINIMDASKVKTMSTGGSVEIGKGKDYIKDLL